MSEEEKAKIEKKKAQQHAAWKRWYVSPKGQAYKLKRKAKLNDPSSQSS